MQINLNSLQRHNNRSSRDRSSFKKEPQFYCLPHERTWQLFFGVLRQLLTGGDSKSPISHRSLSDHRFTRWIGPFTSSVSDSFRRCNVKITGGQRLRPQGLSVRRSQVTCTLLSLIEVRSANVATLNVQHCHVRTLVCLYSTEWNT